MLSLPVTANHNNGSSAFLFIPKPTKYHFYPISASLIPSSPSPSNQQLYQPFRPPPSPIPSKFRSLDTPARLDILSNRLGIWHEWAPLIPSLIHEGFSPPSLEEATGISSIEQNRLVVAAQVRDTLVQSNTDPSIVSFFDNGGAELLYEIRLLSTTQREAAAEYIVKNNLDVKRVKDLARSIKDFPRRRGDKRWECFNYHMPGDCLSFMYYRQSREHKLDSENRIAALNQALQAAESEKAKDVIAKELEEKDEGGEGEGNENGGVRVRVPVVRLKYGEVAESSMVVVLPVCKAEDKERGVMEAPNECKIEGEFGVVVAEKMWERWVALPGWEPVVGMGNGGIVVAFEDARVLPWKVNRWYKEEAILVVADRGRKEVMADDGFYLVMEDGDGGRSGLKVQRGSDLKQRGLKESLATVVLVVRPPSHDDNDQPINDEDWE